MDQAVDAADVDERAEIGQAADDAVILVSDRDRGPQLIGLGPALQGEQGTARAGNPQALLVRVKLGDQDIQRLAAIGFEILDDLNTETSRRMWLEWKRRTDPLHYLDPSDREMAIKKVSLSIMREFGADPEHYYGTINCNGVNARGEVCGVTTTSGMAWKIPGRTGDSPILGAGLYVDNEVGAAGSTGRGEANLFNLSSYLVVENLRRGMHPKDAGMDALRRVSANTVEKRLLTPDGLPNLQLNFYVLNARGEYASVSMYQSTYAVCTESGPQTLASEALIPRTIPE